MTVAIMIAQPIKMVRPRSNTLAVFVGGLGRTCATIAPTISRQMGITIARSRIRST